MIRTIVALILTTSPALAQQQQMPCGPSAMIEKRIKDGSGESVVGAGIVPGGILYTTVNPVTGSFTILLRKPGGQTCLVMAGTGYATQEAVKPGTNL